MAAAIGKAVKDFPKRAFRASRSWSPKNEIYIDRGVIILNKPSGLISQGTAGPDPPRTSYADPNEFDVILSELQQRYNSETIPFPVHRLDKTTTGALILARTKAVAQDLSQQFRSHTVEKSYLALVRGGKKTFPSMTGEIETNLYINDGRVSLKKSGDSEPRPARTSWEVLGSSTDAPVSLLRFQLHTGLKHQLRIHAASVLKAPILGDSLYGSAKIAPQIEAVSHVPEDRVFLHSSSISFVRYRREGPHKRFRLGIIAPLPRDFVVICDDLGIPLDDRAIKGGVYVDGERVDDGQVPGVEGKWLLKI